MVFGCNLYTQYVYTPLVWQDQPWQKPRGKHSWPTATRACRLVFASVDPATLKKYKLLDSYLILKIILILFYAEYLCAKKSFTSKVSRIKHNECGSTWRFSSTWVEWIYIWDVEQ